MKPTDDSYRVNAALARERWGSLSDDCLHILRELTAEHGLSLRCSHLILLDGKWYITHSGLLRIARRNRCIGIHTEVLPAFSAPARGRWVVKATVYKTPRSKGFAGYGDADPSNVSPLVRGSELRIAETRAVNRALRKAYGIGLCSVEELETRGAARDYEASSRESNHNGNGNGQSRLRDRLLLLIRQYQLDAEQVKLYAAHFCGTTSLRETSREQIESFLEHLTTLAAQGRDQLVAEIQSVQPRKKTANNSSEQASNNNKEAA